MQQQYVYIILTVVLALSFQPLRRVFDKATDRVFFRDRYDTQTVLDEIGMILTSERQLDILMQDALKVVCQNLRLNHGCFIVIDDGKVVANTNYGPSVSPSIDLRALYDLGRQLVITDKLELNDQKPNDLGVNQVAVIVPLPLREKIVGYLLLGNKLSGSTYSRQDINLLSSITPGLAVATSNTQAYAQIAQFNQTLQKEIKQATHDLTVANENLKVLDTTKDEFLSLTSHQLRTPLATIHGYLSVLEHGDLGKVSEKQQRFLTSATQAAIRMSNIVNEILDISTMSAGHFTAYKQPEDFVAIVSDEVNALMSTAETKGLVLRYIKPASPLPLIELDKAKIQQVIQNYIDNAINYTPGGEILVTVDKHENNLRLTVKDNGIGVPENEQSKLFDKFIRGSNARQIRPDGTGLGLYLAKKIIDAHNGKIIFSSQENKGSVFGFEVPLTIANSSLDNLPAPSN